MAIQNNFPAISPSLSLDFANVGALDPRITFARASAATYYGTETAKAEENLLIRSQELDNASWSTAGTGLTITANTTTAPDGTATADTLTEDSGTSLHLCSQNISVAGVATLSVFAKLGSGTRFLTIGLSRDITSTASATFDLSLGTNTQTQANGTYSSASATVTAVAESFYRCTLTVTTDTATIVRIGLNDTGTPTTSNRGFGENYVGDNTSSIILWGAQLEQRSAVTAYTPTTTQPITNYIPVLESAAAGEARFDHNPNTFESLGLLIEEQRTNLFVRSEEFSTTWGITGTASIVPDTVIAPTGTLTADKFVLGNTITSNNAAVNQSATKPAVSAPYTASVYIKEGEFNSLRLILRDAANASNFVQAFFNASTGVIAQAASAGGTFTAASATITPVGNGWYRCSVTGTTSTETSLNVRIFNYQNGTDLATGDGFSGIFIWGASLEQGAFPTSYIPTTTAQVTRAADAASMTGANFTSFFNPAEGTVYFEAQSAQGTNAYTYSLFGTNTANRIFANYNTLGRISSGIRVNNVFEADSTTPDNTAPINTFGKGATAYKFNDFGFSWNGAAALTDTSTTLPTVLKLDIGNNGGLAGNFLNGHIRKISFYPQRLSNTNLVALTS